MSTSAISGMPTGLEQSFSRLTTRLFLLSLFRGLGRWLTWMAMILAATLLSDALFHWGTSARMTFFWMVPVAGLILLVQFVIRPLRRSLSPAEKASLIDLHYPELRERLTSTVEFCDPTLPDAYKGSEVMRKMVVSETVSQLPQIDVAKSLPSARMQKAVLYGVAAVTVLLIPFVVRPEHYKLLWTRLLIPDGNYATASNLYFEVPNAERVVARGTSLDLVAAPKWRFYEAELPDSVWLNRVDEEGRIDRSRMKWIKEDGIYEFTFSAVHQGFDYFLTTDSSQTEKYHIQVEDAPEIASVNLEIEPPAYTGRAVDTYSTISGRLPVFERSRLKMMLTFTKPVESLDFVWSESAMSIDEPVTTDQSSLPQPTIELSEDRSSAVLEMTADVNGAYDLTLTDQFDLHNLEDSPHSLNVIRDQPPQVELQSATDDRLEARPNDTVKVQVAASDDVAIGEMEIHLKFADDREDVVSADAAQLGVANLTYKFDVDLSPYQLQEGDVVTWRIRTADERPIPEPNEVWTSPRILAITEDAAPLAQADVEKRQERWKRQLQSIREQLEANSELVNEISQDARKSEREKQPFERDKEVPPLADQQWDLSGRLETLSLEFSNFELYREMTDVLQELAREDLSPLAEDLKSFPETEDEKKSEQLRDNSRGVKQVADNLKQLQGILETLAEIEKDLLELERLGDETEKLADSAVALDQAQQELSEELAANPELKENSDFLEKTDQIEQEFDALAEDQQKLSNALKDLLEKRPELVNAARQMEIDRLKKLAEQARELAEPQEELAKQLQKDARQLADESRQQKNEQERLVKDEKQLLAAADRQADQKAVPQLDRQDQLAAKKKFEQGNLTDAAKSQQQFADELNRLADNLENQQALSENPKEAVQELAQREQQLSQDIKQAQQNNQTTPEESKAQNREFTKRQEAIQQALESLKLPEEQKNQQQTAAESAQKSAENLQKGKSEQALQEAEKAANELNQLAQQLPADLPEQSLDKPDGNPEQIAKEAERLAKDLGKVRKDTAQLAENTPQKDADKKRQAIQKRQQEIARKVENLPKDIGRFPQQEALQNLQEADQQLAENQPAEATANQQQAQDALDQIAAKAQTMAADQRNPGEEMTPENVAEQLRQLANEQQQLAQQTQQQAMQQAGTKEEQTAAQQKLAELQNRQNQLAEKSAKLALETVRNEGTNAETAQQAIQAAREADDAAQKLEAGLVEASAQSGEKSASSSEQLAKLAQAEPQSEQTAQQAGDLAAQQNALAQELKELAKTPVTKKAAQQQAQEKMTAQSQQLAEKFDLSAAKLQSDPFQLAQESDQAQQAGQSASEASQQMQQSQQNQQASNPQQASEQSQQAAQNLKDAAQSVDPQMIAESPVPQEVGQQVTDAFQNLQQAQEFMQQAGQPQARQSEPPPNGDSQEPNGETPEGQAPDGQQPPSQADANGEPRQAPQGMQPSPLQQNAEQLQQAAQQLQQAANQMQPSQAPDGKQSSNPNSQTAESSQDNDQQIAQPKAGVDVEQIEVELERLKKRNWGQLPGKLQTEILQSRQKNPNAEYAPLIKRYFEAIAREQSATRTPPPVEDLDPN